MRSIAVASSHRPPPRLPIPLPAGRFRRLEERCGSLLAYLLPTSLAIAASQSWFRPGTYIATGDVPPFLRRGLAAEFGWLWNHQLTGAGSPSYDVARALEVVILWVVQTLGGSTVQGQRWLYALLFGLAAFGVAFFARALTDRSLAVVASGLVGVFNPYFLVNLPLPLPPLAVGLMGIAGGLVLRAGRGRAIRPGVVAVVSVLASYLMLSPALLALTVAWVVGCGIGASALCGPGSTRRALGLLARSAPWVVLLNLWWLVPLTLIVLGDMGGLRLGAETDAAGWSWSHARNTLPNVLSLNAHWGWGDTGYFPFAARLDHPAWSWLRFLLPAAALSAPLLAGQRRKAALLLAAAALLLVAIGQGLHPPFSALNRGLYAHMPGWWLLREPMSKVGAPLLVAYAALLALALDGLALRVVALGRARLLASVAVLWVGGALAYPYPLWTGQAVRSEGGRLPSAHVTVPIGWLEAAHLVDSARLTGKVLVLPLSPFYQMPTQWEYYGVDLTARELMGNPVIQLLPGSYFEEHPGFESLAVSVEEALLAARLEEVPRLLQALGVSHVVVRHDLDPGLSPRSFADPDRLGESLEAVSGVRLAASFEVVDVYEVVDPHPSPVRAYT
ncbi:MAG: hypothetical protein ACRDVM_03855, partial [Acidimicrobiia bacterium]